MDVVFNCLLILGKLHRFNQLNYSYICLLTSKVCHKILYPSRGGLVMLAFGQ